MIYKRFSCLIIASLVALSAGQSLAADTEAQKATQALAAKNVSVDNDTFVEQVRAGNIDNINLFLAVGAGPGTQNKDALPALIAAFEAPDDNAFNLLIGTLPADASAASVVNLQDKTGNTALHIAITKGKEAAVDALLARGAGLTVTNKLFATPLIVALQQKNDAIAKKLIEADSKAAPPYTSIELEDSKGNRALSYAILNQSKELVDLLMNSRTNIMQADSVGVTPLMLAAQTGNETITRTLLAAGSNINATSKSGNTAVSYAIRGGHGPLARSLLEKVMQSKDAPPLIDYMPLMAAALEAEKTDPEFFKFLLAQVGTTQAIPTSLLFKALDQKNSAVAKMLLERNISLKPMNENNETLFYRAIEAGLEDVALELMKKDADYMQSGSAGSTPIARAVRHNMAKVVAALLAKGISADQKTSEGYTLAEMCVYSGYPETLEVLLAGGAKLEMEFALLWAIREGKGKAVPVLLKRGAVPNIMNPDGTPALTLAAEAGQVEAVKALIEHKAAIDYPSKTQQITALAAAAHAGQVEVVRLLVEAGANIEATDNYSMTPLAHAAVLSRTEVVQYLLSKGANPKAMDAQKRTPSDIASQAPASPERDKTLKLLVEAGQVK